MTPLPRQRVLYIEDHADTVGMVTLMLEGGGFSVQSVSTLEAGLEAAAEQKFDLYLLDVWLPDGSGMDLCRKIREFDAKTPIVFYSAAAYDGDTEAALERRSSLPDQTNRLTQPVRKSLLCAGPGR